jgi:hypothetical protein
MHQQRVARFIYNTPTICARVECDNFGCTGVFIYMGSSSPFNKHLGVAGPEIVVARQRRRYHPVLFLQVV